MVNMAAEESLFRGTEAEPEAEEDEISVGCPSPALRHGGSTDGDTNGHSSSAESDVNENRQDDYFKPLKRLKMMQIEQVSYSIAGKKAKRIRPPRRQSLPETEEPAGGVKSFSILDILNHRPAAATTAAKEARIVRPWDSGGLEGASPPPPLLPPPAHRGLLPPPPLLYRLPFGVGLPPPTMVGHNAARPKSAETYETCSSGRSSTGGSDCCTSPDLLNCSSSVASSPRRPHQSSSSGAHGRKGAAKDDTSPLDALFQMTSKTFEELNGESQEGQGSHMNMFSNRQQPKKKRKSRTAFTNHQIFELEKRFLYQKYLSPADRDEIAAQLGLSNAQVITWFQNRRAKLKRDMEELKKDVENAKVFVTQKSFLESVHSFSMLKKKSIALDDEKSSTNK